MELVKVHRLLIAYCLILSSTAWAGPRDQAKRIHDRLTGVPPTPELLAQMEELVKQGDAYGAAWLAMENPHFYNTGLVAWLTTWTNVDESPSEALNDFTATMIGAIRDEVPFGELLYEDLLYTVQQSGLPAYSSANNDHYMQAQRQRVDLAGALRRQEQSRFNNLGETAGVITTRGFGAAYFSAGTNRRALRFVFKNFLCMDMEQLSDTSTPDFRIRQDVDRSPGGDSTVFRSKCAGCHAGMDGLAGAFAYYDFAGDRVVYDATQVRDKYLQNGNVFPDGYVTEDDAWVNLWAAGKNQFVGWSGATDGRGARSLGKMISQTRAFPECMAERVFAKVCLRSPERDEERQQVEVLSRDFVDSDFNMKELFARTAVACTGESE